jgi:3-hydroxyisobutyrate dehydrogenase-like beta-hydroxyacid dehydrogenase
MMRDEDMVGPIGLGAMGAAYARRLLDRGRQVLGFDVAEAALAHHRGAGGLIAGSVEEIAERCEMIVTSLPSFSAFEAVNDSIASRPRAGGYVVDTNTMSRTQKEDARVALARAGWSLLDCTVSGNPAMVLDDSYSFFLSGEDRNVPQVRRVVDLLASRVFDLGDFGAATSIKLIVNHLVMIHNAAAAEAMSLGIKAGLDRKMLFDIISASGGSSKIFEARGRMMANARYPESTTYKLMIDKDGAVISDLARELRHPVPMFATAYQAHVMGLAQGWGTTDPSSLCAVFEGLSGQRPAGPTASDIESSN